MLKKRAMNREKKSISVSNRTTYQINLSYLLLPHNHRSSSFRVTRNRNKYQKREVKKKGSGQGQRSSEVLKLCEKLVCEREKPLDLHSISRPFLSLIPARNGLARNESLRSAYSLTGRSSGGVCEIKRDISCQSPRLK